MEPGQDRHPAPFARLVALLRPESKDLWAIVAFAFVVGALSLAAPIAVQQLVNTVAFGGLLQPLVVLSVLLLAVLTFAAVLNMVEAYVVEVLQRRMFVRVVADLAYRLPRVAVSAFDRIHGPEAVNRFFDVMTLQKAGATLLLDGVGTALQAHIGMFVLAFYHPMLLGFDLILLVAIVTIVFGFGRGAVRTAVAESKAKYAVASWMEELARHPIAFKVGGGPDHALERADELTRVYVDARRDHYRIVFRQLAGAYGLQVLASSGLLVIGGALVIGGQLTLGQLVAAELIVTLVVSAFAKLGKHLETFYDLLAAVDKVGHLLDLPLERRGGDVHREPSASPDAGMGAAVRLVDVGFSYLEGRTVFEGVNATIAPGERLAVTGASGAGKSTLLDLLFGLRAPTAGYVELDGTDLRELRLESVREHVVAVKGFELIEGTILENVRMGRSNVDLADVQKALAAVALLDVVRALPDGMDTYLVTGGAPLSLGQARRVMLARAIAGRPRLLLIDESLAGLDEDSRDVVLDFLFDPARSWTLIVASHEKEILDRCRRTLHLRGADTAPVHGEEEGRAR